MEGNDPVSWVVKMTPDESGTWKASIFDQDMMPIMIFFTAPWYDPNEDQGKMLVQAVCSLVNHADSEVD